MESNPGPVQSGQNSYRARMCSTRARLTVQLCSSGCLDQVKCPPCKNYAGRLKLLTCFLPDVISFYCAVPENIHTPPMMVIGNSRGKGGGGVLTAKNFKV